MDAIRGCSKCKGKFPATTEYFRPYNAPLRRSGKLRAICRVCEKIESEQYRTEFKANNLTAYRNMQKNHHLSKYGLSLEDYGHILKRQGGKCAICGRDEIAPNRKYKYFFVDHNHKTGEVRGLLCYWCNTGLGMFGDSSDILQKVIAYTVGEKKL